MFEVNNNTGDIFKFVSPAAIMKSKMAAIEPFLYVFNKTNIECFSFESIMQRIDHSQYPACIGSMLLLTVKIDEFVAVVCSVFNSINGKMDSVES